MRTLVGALAVLAAVAAGCADHENMTTASDRSASSATSSGKVIEITMADNRFEPAEVTVPSGTKVTFRITNTGSAVHAALIGDSDAQREHMAEMTAGSMMAPDGDHGDHGGMSGMGSAGSSGSSGGMHHSGAAKVVTVDPGEQGEITTTFDRAGTTLIGCHQPGHWEAGMKATITVR